MIGSEEKKDLPRIVQKEYGTAFENLRKFKNFYGALAEGNEPNSRILKLPEDLSKNAVHLLLFTVLLNKEHTADTLKYVFKVKLKLESLNHPSIIFKMALKRLRSKTKFKNDIFFFDSNRFARACGSVKTIVVTRNEQLPIPKQPMSSHFKTAANKNVQALKSPRKHYFGFIFT